MQLNFLCKPCNSDASGLNLFRKEIGALNSKLDEFIEKSVNEHLQISKALTDTVASFKPEMADCLRDMKSEIVDCNKLLNHIDASTSKKIVKLEDEHNMLHKRINRADIVVNGLPDGRRDFIELITANGKIYKLDISTNAINYACYFNNRKSMLYKFNNVFYTR